MSAASWLQQVWQRTQASLTLTTRRMFRSSLSLTICIALTLCTPTSRFLGPNVFLLGTVAIYLFPKSTVGAQLVSSAVAYLGFLLGLVWYNLFEHIAILLSSPGDRILLYISFVAGAWLCGYFRSRYPISYLGINFFMLVNIFGLVVGIQLDTHIARTFTDFFYVFTFGTLIALLCSFIFPENTARSLEHQLLEVVDKLHVGRQFLSLDCNDYSAPASASAPAVTPLNTLQASQDKLTSSIAQSSYEILWSRLSPEAIGELNRMLRLVMQHMRVLDIARERYRTLVTTNNQSVVISEQCKTFLANVDHLQSVQIDFLRSLLSGRIDGVEATKRLKDVELGKIESIEVCSILKQQVQDLWKARLEIHVQVDNSKINQAHVAQMMDIALLVCRDLHATCEVLELTVQKRAKRKIFWPRLPSLSLLFTKVIDPVEVTSGRRNSTISLQSVKLSFKSFTYWRYWAAHTASTMRDSRHTQYALKFSLVMGILSIWPFIHNWSIWYSEFNAHWSMIFGMVVMETTRGLLLRSALMKGAGALGGGLLALAVFEIGVISCAACSRTDPNVYFLVAATFASGLLIYFFALHVRLAKSGLVGALAYNLVLGVGFQTQNAALAFGKRLAAQFVGISVAVLVHVLIYPYHARKELKNEICAAFDDLASMYHDSMHTINDTKFSEQGARGHLQYASQLIQFTKFEPSLKGYFPKDDYKALVDVLMLLIDTHVCHAAINAYDSSSGKQLSKDVHKRCTLHRAVAQDLFLLSHAKGTRSHAIALLAVNSSVFVSALHTKKKKVGEEDLSIIYESELTSLLIEDLRGKLHELISGRSLPMLLDSAAQLRDDSSTASPIMSGYSSRRGSLANPMRALILPATLMVPSVSWPDEQATDPTKPER